MSDLSFTVQGDDLVREQAAWPRDIEVAGAVLRGVADGVPWGAVSGYAELRGTVVIWHWATFTIHAAQGSATYALDQRASAHDVERDVWHGRLAVERMAAKLSDEGAV